MKDKKSIKNFLNKLTEANKKEFGDKPLDCCEINKTTKEAKVNKDNKKKQKTNKTKGHSPNKMESDLL